MYLQPDTTRMHIEVYLYQWIFFNTKFKLLKGESTMMAMSSWVLQNSFLELNKFKVFWNHKKAKGSRIWNRACRTVQYG